MYNQLWIKLERRKNKMHTKQLPSTAKLDTNDDRNQNCVPIVFFYVCSCIDTVLLVSIYGLLTLYIRSFEHDENVTRQMYGIKWGAFAKKQFCCCWKIRMHLCGSSWSSQCSLTPPSFLPLESISNAFAPHARDTWFYAAFAPFENVALRCSI